MKFNEDQQQVVATSCKELGHIISDVANRVKTNTLPDRLKDNCLALAGLLLERVNKTVGYDKDANLEQERLLQELRQANGKIRELETELGLNFSSEALGQRLKLYDKSVGRFWKSLGFCLVEGLFTPYGQYKVVLKCFIDRPFLSSTFDVSETPVSDYKNKQSLFAEMQENLEVYQSPDEHTPVVLDNYQNRTWIFDKLQEQYPEITVDSWVNHKIYRADGFQIREIEARIPLNNLENSLENKND